MQFPRLKIDLNKIKHNTTEIVKLCNNYGISVAGVTKSFGGIPEIAQAMVAGGIEMIADSRIENLRDLAHLDMPKMLLRIPMQSEIDDVIKYADISLNSNIDTIRKLSVEAELQNKTHNVILMIDIGDLREGLWFESLSLIDEIVEQIIKLNKINLIGMGTNITCYGGIVANEGNMSLLVKIVDHIGEKYNLKFEIISGGNSSSLFFLDKLPKKINNLRLGESIILGRETRYGGRIKDTYDDAFLLEAEIVEIYEKPSMPFGEIGMDAFGDVPTFIDVGIIKRGILAIGRQDVMPENLTPIDQNIHVIGASSDHLIVDINIKDVYSVGSIVGFRLDYGGVLRTTTSKYVKKMYVQ